VKVLLKKCYVCSETVPEEFFLCKKCIRILEEMINKKENIVSNIAPHHCNICGEFEGRIIIEYKVGFYCDKDIKYEKEQYAKIKD
jgi:predicted nucleic acid-binding Zn ribbon protein